jgi:hypothetical protein
MCGKQWHGPVNMAQGRARCRRQMNIKVKTFVAISIMKAAETELPGK